MIIHIAVVDDEERIRNGLAKLIEMSGSEYKVTGIYGSAQELLDQLEQYQPDLVITDIKMPQMDGMELIEKVRGQYPGIKLAILSGFNDFVFARQAIRFGVEDYLLKPVDQAELKELLGRIQTEVAEEKTRQELSAKERIRLLLGMSPQRLREPVAREAVYQLSQTAELRERFAVFLLRSDIDLPETCLAHYTALWKRDYRLLEWEPKQTFVAAAVKPGEQEHIVRELGNELLQYLPKHAAARLGVSRIHFGADELRTAYEEARAGLQLSWYEPVIKAMTLADDKERCKSADSPHILKRLDKSLRSALDLLDDGRVMQILEDWTREVATLRPFWRELSEACGMLFEMLRSEQTDSSAAVFGAGDKASSGSGGGVSAGGQSAQFAVGQLARSATGQSGEWPVTGQPAAAIPGDPWPLAGGFGEGASGYGQPQPLTPAAYPHWEAFAADLLERAGEMLKQLKEARQENRAVETVKAYIQQHYREELELSRLADTVYLTPSYLSKLFKTETGETITDYIIAVRIERAKELLLKDQALKTYEVGEQIGYPDPAYFNKVFKKVAGFTPKEYRERMR